jgi:hypothetical protein
MSALLRRSLRAVAALGVVASVTLATSTAASAASPTPSGTLAGPVATVAPATASATVPATAPANVAAPDAVTVAGVPCSSISQLGDKKVVSDLGMQAFTVRQYIGWCSDSRGSAWMNFASVYVWDQYHDRGFAYRVNSGIVVRGEPEARGFATSGNRQQTSYSLPVRTTQVCTQGWGKIFRAGSESPQGLTPTVC